MDRKHGEVNYHLTQFLTGHGGYRNYLYKFGLDESPNCPVCIEAEDAEHVIFKCSRFADIRSALETELGSTITPENIVGFMLTSEEKWNLISKFVTQISMMLRIEEERRKAERAGVLDAEVA